MKSEILEAFYGEKQDTASVCAFEKLKSFTFQNTTTLNLARHIGVDGREEKNCKRKTTKIENKKWKLKNHDWMFT